MSKKKAKSTPKKKAAKKTKPEEIVIPKRRGRPSSYTPALGRAICKMLAAGMTLQAVCKRPKMPDERRVREWARNPDHPFSPHYARAREVGYHKMADDIISIADDASLDMVQREREDGSTYMAVDHDHIARSRLRVDARKWLLSKALPKLYGDKSEVNVNADHKHNHTVEPLSESAEWLARLLGDGAGRPPAKPVSH